MEHVKKIKKPARPHVALTREMFHPPEQSKVKRTAVAHFPAHTAASVTTTSPRGPIELPSKAPQQSARPDLASLSKKKITFLTVLKGDDKKISCLIDVDGQSFVVKGGDGNAYIEDHLVHSEIFQKLNMPGVAAPGVVKLSDTFLHALDGELAHQANPRVALLRKALKQNQQVAATAPGFTLENVLGDHSMSTALAEKIRNLPDEKALAALLDELTVTKGLFAEARNLLDSLKERPNLTTVAELERLQVDLVSPKNQAALSLALSVRQLGAAAAVKAHDTSMANLAQARNVLIDRVKSKEGASALGAMCATDLLCGMGDRVLGDWNGGNFMFDPATKEFWCVDNAKSDFGLTGLIPIRKEDVQDVNIRWREWVLGNGILDAKDATDVIGARMHTILFHADRKDDDFAHTIKLTEDEDTLTRDGVADGVARTIEKLRRLVDDDALSPVVRKNLKERLAFIDQKEAFTRASTFERDFLDIPAVTKAKFFEKTSRLKDTRTTLEQQAKALKNDARSGKLTRDELLKREHALLMEQQKEGIDDANRDRRLDKALFESKLARLLLDLDAKTLELSKMRPPLIKQTAAQKDDFKNGLKPWIAELEKLKDKGAIKALQVAQTKLEKAMDALV